MWRVLRTVPGSIMLAVVHSGLLFWASRTGRNGLPGPLKTLVGVDQFLSCA